MPPKSNSEPTGPHDAAALQKRGAAGAIEYKVGPDRPPKEYQFKKGRSGNPKGAKRKSPSLVPDVKRLLQKALDRKITVTQGERKRTLTLLEAGIEQLVSQFVKGDRHARNELFKRAEQLGLDLLGTRETTSQMRGDAIGKDEGDLTREEIANLCDEQLKLLLAAERLKDEIRCRRHISQTDKSQTDLNDPLISHR
jgi:hypothetical protein